MSIRSKIQALITAANAKTGESDTTLTDAVQTLVDGYGQGGGERTPVKLGEYTITEPINTLVITLTEEMKALDKLYVITTDNITKDQSDWLYFAFQNGTQGYFGSSTSNKVNGVLFNINGVELSENAIPTRSQFVAGQTGSTATNVGTKATNLRLFCYSSSKRLISGTIEIWG